MILRHFQRIFLYKGIMPYFKGLCKIPIDDMDVFSMFYEISQECIEENWCCVTPLHYLLTSTLHCFHELITTFEMSNIKNHHSIALITHTPSMRQILLPKKSKLILPLLLE